MLSSMVTCTKKSTWTYLSGILSRGRLAITPKWFANLTSLYMDYDNPLDNGMKKFHLLSSNLDLVNLNLIIPCFIREME